VSPDRDIIAAVLKDQRGATSREIAPIINHISLSCTFYQIPIRAFNYSNMNEPRNLVMEDLPQHSGTLTFNALVEQASTGAFKTSHVGSVILVDGASLWPFTGDKVCVKQTYYKKLDSNAIGRYEGPHALGLILDECRCLDWATSLLQLTYDFIDRELQVVGAPGFIIPQLRFIHALLAYCAREKRAFLIEEWIETSVSDPFFKYINNGIAQSCIPTGASPEAHVIAEFLCFAQHVQWSKTGYQMFTSDFQGS
jgi:hypothetical protein